MLAAYEATKKKELPFVYKPTDTAMDCYNNVADRCRREGGMVMCGWSIRNLKRAIAEIQEMGLAKAAGVNVRGIRGTELETHCIWQRPDGTHLDVTPTEGGTSCRFVRDDRVSVGASVHVIVFNRERDRARYGEFVDRLDEIKGTETRFVATTVG